MDLLSLVLTLRLAGQPNPLHPFPLWWARAAHALLLNVVRQSNDALAAQLHEENGLRPFTVSTLIGRFTHSNPTPDQLYRLRFTAYQPELSALLWQAASAGPLAPGSLLELDYIPFRVEAVSPAADAQSPASPGPAAAPQPEAGPAEDLSWAAVNTYADLSAPYLLAHIPAPRRLTLRFTSPTTFKSNGMHLPVPLPELVFGSLLEHWNAFAPLTFPPEARRYAAECLAISEYRLSSRPVPVKSGGLRIGAVGEITYSALNYDRYWMSLMAALAEFALFASVGAGAASGLGQARRVSKI